MVGWWKCLLNDLIEFDFFYAELYASSNWIECGYFCQRNIFHKAFATVVRLGVSIVNLIGTGRFCVEIVEKDIHCRNRVRASQQATLCIMKDDS